MFLFTKENSIALVRTVITFVYGWLLTQFPAVQEWIMSQEWLDANTAIATFVVVVGGLIYQVIRVLAEKWGWVGYFLIFNEKPAYASTTSTAPAVTGAHEASGELPPI